MTKVENWKPPSEPYKMWEFSDVAHVSFKISYGFEWTQSIQKADWLHALEKLITLRKKYFLRNLYSPWPKHNIII